MERYENDINNTLRNVLQKYIDFVLHFTIMKGHQMFLT